MIKELVEHLASCVARLLFGYMAHNSSGKLPPSFVLKRHFTNWNILQDAALTLFSGVTNLKEHKTSNRGVKIPLVMCAHMQHPCGVILGSTDLWHAGALPLRGNGQNILYFTF